ncbi:MAG: hypothetical protein J1F66_05345 [Clostridiales bacterium]|nr:hypothetical protein [Clostridiales bacterium]
MSLTKTYDVFIAYHGSYDPEGARTYADKVYEYLNDECKLKCFYFPKSSSDIYKANMLEVMRSRVFLLVCTDGLHRLKSGKIDPVHHHELATEIDAFYAMTQMGEANVTDAKVVVCGEFRKGDEEHIHELFANRTHFYYDENSIDQLYQWVLSRLDASSTWQQTQITHEIQAVFATRAAMNQSCKINDLVAQAKSVRVVGISNSEMTARINPDAIINCIENGGIIEMIFLDPEGEFTKKREQEENLRQDRIKIITQVNIGTACTFYERMTKNRENFTLYKYDKQPRMNMIFVDDKLILQYYANNIPGIQNPTFLVERQSNSPVYEFCEKVYAYLKESAVALEVD